MNETVPMGAVLPVCAVTDAVRMVLWLVVMVVALAESVVLVATPVVVPVTVTFTVFEAPFWWNVSPP